MKTEKHSAMILRIGISSVILWFALTLLQNPSQLIQSIPLYTSIIPLQPIILIYLYAFFLITFSVFLMLGIFTRVSALFLGLNMLHVSFVVGYSATGIRDIAIAIAILSVFIHGPDEYCLDKHLNERMMRETIN